MSTLQPMSYPQDNLGGFFYTVCMDRREYYRERDRKRRLDPIWIERKKKYARKYYLKYRKREIAKAKERYKKLHTYCTVCSKNYPLPDLPFCEECLERVQ